MEHRRPETRAEFVRRLVADKRPDRQLFRSPTPQAQQQTNRQKRKEE